MGEPGGGEREAVSVAESLQGQLQGADVVDQVSKPKGGLTRENLEKALKSRPVLKH